MPFKQLQLQLRVFIPFSPNCRTVCMFGVWRSEHGALFTLVTLHIRLYTWQREPNNGIRVRDVKCSALLMIIFTTRLMPQVRPRVFLHLTDGPKRSLNAQVADMSPICRYLSKTTYNKSSVLLYEVTIVPYSSDTPSTLCNVYSRPGRFFETGRSG